ncbi:hypothetical protein [Cryobacterium glaciale]|uniref:hypothetical protein n=1 Tax=Cryobacterium glaciale TaxID=1259145 RepID=UPI001F54000C|nr:hypothetical protein [Cryobacterium glaciale]
MDDLDGPLTAEPPHPINWNLLSADDAEAEWIELNRWVNWLRRTYGLPASVVPPFWHRHPIGARLRLPSVLLSLLVDKPTRCSSTLKEGGRRNVFTMRIGDRPNLYEQASARCDADDFNFGTHFVIEIRGLGVGTFSVGKPIRVQRALAVRTSFSSRAATLG